MLRRKIRKEEKQTTFMPAPYGEDLRQKAIAAIERGERKSDVSRMFNIAHQQINGVIGGAVSDSTYQGVADDGVSAVFDPVAGQVVNGGLDSSMANVFEFNFDWLVARSFGIFGRYTYASTHLKPIDADINAQAIPA